MPNFANLGEAGLPFFLFTVGLGGGFGLCFFFKGESSLEFVPNGANVVQIGGEQGANATVGFVPVLKILTSGRGRCPSECVEKGLHVPVQDLVAVFDAVSEAERAGLDALNVRIFDHGGRLGRNESPLSPTGEDLGGFLGEDEILGGDFGGGEVIGGGGRAVPSVPFEKIVLVRFSISEANLSVGEKTALRAKSALADINEPLRLRFGADMGGDGLGDAGQGLHKCLIPWVDGENVVFRGDGLQALNHQLD